MTCKGCTELMTGALYGELSEGDRALFEAHTASCSACSTLFRGMQETARIMEAHERVSPDEASLDEYWEKIRARISPAASPRHPRWRPAAVPAWAYAAAAVLLVALGIYLGRMYFPFRERETPRVAAAAVGDSVNEQALAYLERTKNLLLGVVNMNTDDATRGDLSRHQQASRQLIGQAVYFKSALNRPDQEQLRQLIHDLEVILLQLANIEVKPGVPAVELVKKGVYQKSILFKINVEEIRAMKRNAAPAETSTKSTS